MVAHFTIRTYGVNQAFQFVDGIWLHRKSRQIRKTSKKIPILHHTCAELPSFISSLEQLSNRAPREEIKPEKIKITERGNQIVHL